MIDFRYLPAFLAVAESESFTEAGNRLHISTSAVSRQIQLLEESCKIQLVFRSPQEVSLTDAGRKLFESLKHFQFDAGEILQEKTPTTFKIGILQGVLENWFLDFLTENQLFKEFNLEIRVGSPAELVKDLEGGLLDASFFSFATRAAVPGSLKVIKLFPENIVLISKNKIQLKEIDEHPWICFSKSTWLIQHQQRQPSRYIVVNNMNAVVELVRRGAGIAMVPSYMLSGRRDLHAIPINKFSKAHISLLVRQFDREPAYISNFIELVKKSAGNRQG